MCGISGYITLLRNFRPEKFSAANNIAKYRGPNDFGYVSFDNNLKAFEHSDEWLDDLDCPETVMGAFGFRRLGIIDLSHAGHQPMPDADQRYWIVFNGELYNYIEMRAELEKLGHRFRSSSDTEVVVTAYKEWGENCQDKFNGMWAFAILDTVKRELFCSRDRFGIKPFYFYASEKQLLFASEVKQVLMMMEGAPEVNKDTVFDFLAYGARNHTSATFHENVTELRGGECMTLTLTHRDNITIEKRQWWDLKESSFTGSEQDATEQFLELLTDSVTLRLRGDVPTGTALSGGVDSNGLVALIDEITGNKRQDVFTVYSDDNDCDELVYAQDTINRFNSKSHITEFGLNDIDVLEKVTFHRDQPLDDAGALGGWILQSLIKSSGIIVSLSGQGADELMGGYSSPPHVEHYLDSLSQGHFIHAHKELFYGFKNSSMSMPDTTVKFGREVGLNLLNNMAYKVLLNRNKKFIHDSFTTRHEKNSGLLRGLRRKNAGNVFSLRKWSSYRELKVTHLPYLLQNVDRDSMAHSLETRVPFLDYRLAEFLFSVPDSMLQKNGHTKHLFRRAVSGKLSDDIVWNKTKKGFTTPKDQYLSSGADYIYELLDQNRDHPILNIDQLKDALKAPKVTVNRILWRSLCYLIWERQQKHAQGVGFVNPCINI